MTETEFYETNTNTLNAVVDAGAATNGHRRYRRTNDVLAVIDAAILEVAEAEQPVTVRGLFYRVMSRGLVEKSEKGYGVVQRQTLKLRRAGVLPYGWVTDGSRLRLKPMTWSSTQAALENTAKMYRRDLWIDQDMHVEVWTEKDAIRGVVYPVTEEYDVPLMISRGYSSETFLQTTGEEINAKGRDAVIYQLGDHDPSGVDAWRDIQDKLRGFVDPGIDLVFERIAVTPEQITELGLPTRPTKKKDPRAAKFVGASVEVDAIPSTILRELVREAIEHWIDPERLRILRVAEQSERELLQMNADLVGRASGLGVIG